MSERYGDYRSSRSPLRDTARSSLQEFGTYSYAGSGGLHAVPTRREFGIAPRSSERGLLTPVVTTTYKITPDVSRSNRTTIHRGASRERRSTLDLGRPASIHIISAPSRDRPKSPLYDSFRRSSDEHREESHGNVASSSSSSKHRHKHHPHHSATIDNSDMDHGLRVPSSGLSRRNSGRRSGPGHRDDPRSTRLVPLERHPDTMADDYGDNGYGYTNPRDVVQYDLNRSQPHYYDRKPHDYSDRSGYLGVAGPAEMTNIRSYDNKSRPPVSNRGMDRMHRSSGYESSQVLREPSLDPVYQYESNYNSRGQQQERSYPESEYARTRDALPPKSGPQTYRDTRDDNSSRRRDVPRAERSSMYLDDDRSSDRSDSRRFRNSYSGQDNYSGRDDRLRGSDDDYEKHNQRREEKRSSNRDTLASLAGLAGAALGIKGLAEAFGGDEDHTVEKSRSGDEREHRRPKHREEYKSRDHDERAKEREESDRSGRSGRHKHRDDENPNSSRNMREKNVASSSMQASKHRDEDDSMDSTPMTSGASTPARAEQAPKRVPRIAALPAFDPKDTMDLRALKEALNHNNEDRLEPVPVSVRGPPRPPKEPLTDRGVEESGRYSHMATNSERLPNESREMFEAGRSRRNSSIPSESQQPLQSSERAITIVDKPSNSSEEVNKPAVKGILRQPRDAFPEEPNPIREGVAPLKDSKKDGVPPDARWTRISRSMVNPEALELGKERFEARDDCVIVLRVLSKDEIQGYAEVTQKLRENREEREEAERRRRRRARHERHAHERREAGTEKKDNTSSRDPRRSRNERTSHSESDTTEDEATYEGNSSSRTRSKGVVFDE